LTKIQPEAPDMRKIFRFAIFATTALALLAAAQNASAQERMRPVGKITFAPQPAEVQRGVVELRREDQPVKALRILADDGSAEIRDIRLVYEDGNRERVRVRQTLREGDQTAVIRLEVPARLRAVEINYIPLGPVTLVVTAEAGRRAPPPPQWTELGCKKVGIIADRDSIIITTPERFSALRLRSTGFDVDMGQMGIRYANGQRELYDINSVIRSGGATPGIDLRGDQRRIGQIDLLYRARGISIGGGKTRLCVDGRSAGDRDADADD
jgi:hypothetical protein